MTGRVAGAPEQPTLPLEGGLGRQLALPLAVRDRASALVVTAANRRAVERLRDPEGWTARVLILSGPRRSGRSLHARLAAAAGARVLDGADRRDERELFTAWEDARSGPPLLLVADAPPPVWTVELPDLRTRLAACAVERLGDPDEALADALVELALRRAGLPSTPRLRAEALRPIERTHWAIERLTDALVQAGPLTRATVVRTHAALGVARAAA